VVSVPYSGWLHFNQNDDKAQGGKAALLRARVEAALRPWVEDAVSGSGEAETAVAA